MRVYVVRISARPSSAGVNTSTSPCTQPPGLHAFASAAAELPQETHLDARRTRNAQNNRVARLKPTNAGIAGEGHIEEQVSGCETDKLRRHLDGQGVKAIANTLLKTRMQCVSCEYTPGMSVTVYLTETATSQRHLAVNLVSRAT